MPFEPMARFPRSDQPFTEPMARLQIILPETQYHGLHSLIEWISGFQAAGKGDVPGYFELVMHFRELNHALRDSEKAAQKNCRHVWKDHPAVAGVDLCSKCGADRQRP